MKRRILISLALLLMPLVADAAVPITIGWQGIVEDDTGVALQGTHAMTFRLYDAPTNGTLLWEETQHLDLVDGLGEASLGSVNQLISIDFDQPLWLALLVDGGVEMAPRAEFSSVPYALAVADGAAVKSLNGVRGDLNLIAGSNVTLVPNGNDLTINATGGGGTDGDWNINGNNLTLGVSGNVGVGQSNPTHKLDIATPINVPVSIKMRSGGSWPLVIEQSPESIFTIRNGGSERLAITPGGRIGIGTTSPQTRLHLNASTDELFIGDDTGPGSLPLESLGVRLGSSKLEFYRWIQDEGNASVVSAGIFGENDGWWLDDIIGVHGGWSVEGTLRADQIFELSDSDDVNIRLKRDANTMWFMRNDVSEGDDFVIRAASNSLPAIQIDQATRTSSFGGDVDPSGSALWSLGSSDKRWSIVYAMLVDTPSDRRLKKDIEDLEYGLEDLMAMRPVRYGWKEHPELGPQLGLIAQELREVVPEIVNEAEDEEKSLSVEYTSLIPVLISAIQDQQAQIESQNEELTRQARAIERLSLQVADTQGTTEAGASAAKATGSTD